MSDKKNLVDLIEKIETSKTISSEEQNEINGEAFKRRLEPKEIMALNHLTELIETGKVTVQ